jgi:3-(3-hydroxy-phenyl)propionate hydroxylase
VTPLPQQVEVAVVGCGPIGALLANLLGRRGLRVAVLERQPGIHDLPRAVHLDGEAMRVFQAAGLAGAILPETRVNPGMLFRDPAGRVLVDWSRDTGTGPQGWAESYRCHQPGVERALRAGLARFARVSLHAGVEVTGLAQDPDGVTLETSAGALRAGHVVACDGAGSGLRQALGIGQEDLGFQERWLVADLALRRPRPDLGDHSVQFCDPARPATYVRGVGDRRRWEMRLDPGDPDSFAPGEVWARLARWIGPDEARLERAAVYVFRSRLALRWRAGRVLLAGDAAHQMPPFMGQGLCAGMRDAANLAWKLAALRGGAGPALLDSYETERAPNARAFIQLSVDLGRLINRTARGEVPEGRMRSIQPDLGPGLGVRDGAGGALVPQPLVDGRRGDEAARGGFWVLARERLDSALPLVQGGADWLAARGLAAALVRPDGYALAGARDAAALRRAEARHAPLIRATGGWA